MVPLICSRAKARPHRTKIPSWFAKENVRKPKEAGESQNEPKGARVEPEGARDNQDEALRILLPKELL
jgi:hypothetical protein